MKLIMKILCTLLIFSSTVYGQYFKTTFTYSPSTGLLKFYIKPTGTNMDVAIESFQFDVTYPIGVNVNFGTVINNTADFPGLNVTNTNTFTLNGEWVYRWEHQGVIPQKVYNLNTEYLVFSVPVSGNTTMAYKSDYVFFDPVFTVNDDMGNPLWDNTPPHDVYYPNQQQNGDIIYILLNITLPIELSQFSVQPQKESMLLSWTTESEFNFSGFDIERSLDGSHFNQIHFMPGIGENKTMHYNYTDINIIQGIPYYYRLKYMDQDGRSSYSKILSAIIHVENPKPIRFYYSTPGQFHIQYDLKHEDEIELIIYDIHGRLIVNNHSTEVAGKHDLSFSNPDLGPGIYIVYFKNSKGTFSEKFALIQ